MKKVETYFYGDRYEQFYFCIRIGDHDRTVVPDLYRTDGWGLRSPGQRLGAVHGASHSNRSVSVRQATEPAGSQRPDRLAPRPVAAANYFRFRNVVRTLQNFQIPHRCPGTSPIINVQKRESSH